MKSLVLQKFHQRIFGIFGNNDTVSCNSTKKRISNQGILFLIKNPYEYEIAKIGENEDICF
jgi:hypothetical protein